jgi:hypothetical protein
MVSYLSELLLQQLTLKREQANINVTQAQSGISMNKQSRLDKKAASLALTWHGLVSKSPIYGQQATLRRDFQSSQIFRSF